MKVCKFGGSSVASAEQILKVIDIVVSDPGRRVVVVSAPGRRSKGDDKVTDMLISCAVRVLDGGSPTEEARRVVERFESIRADLGLDPALVEFVRKTLHARLTAPAGNAAAFTDAVKALGEEFSARFCAAAFTMRGHPAVYVDPKDSGMLLSEEYGGAQLLPESYGRLRDHLGAIREIVVYPGFFGYTRRGSVATFPRGGSDITGAILAAALKAEVYENFTDVDSVFPVDPRIVPEVEEGIPEMTYREMRELAYSGFGVFHDEAIQPAIRASIPINIRNTNHPDAKGTLVLPTRKATPGRVMGLASARGFGTLYVGKYLMNREVGFAARVLQILADENISFEHMPTGVDSLSVVMRDSIFCESAREHVIARIRRELGADEVSYESGLALIMVVGEGMRETVGTCNHVVGVLARAGVNIEMINQGSSEISMMFGIRETSLETAVRALYQEFFARKK
ncbi:MAG: aspartate kinase [Kiritimatiellia bacterium]|jgi:aspartate kinase